MARCDEPVENGGLGFDLKWNMGWMHDMLEYFIEEIPCTGRYHHRNLTFALLYAFSEDFSSHLARRSGAWQGIAPRRRCPAIRGRSSPTSGSCYAYMFAHPGKKLLFMGSDFGQWDEWNHDKSLDWHLLNYDTHRGVQRFGGPGPRLSGRPRLHEVDFRTEASTGSISGMEQRRSFLRRGGSGLCRRVRLQLHARPAGEVPRRRPLARAIPRGAEQRRRRLRREQHRKQRLRRGGEHPVDGATPLRLPYASPAGRALPPARTLNAFHK